MKKSLFILATLLCLALFALPAMATEAECTHESIRCTGVCEDCLTEGLSSDEPLHSADDILISDTHCMYICGDCGAEYNYRTHQTYCDMNGECLWCQTTTGTIEVTHNNAAGEGSDESGHWLICECGEEYRKTAHYRECYDPEGVCASCGYETTNLELWHDFLSDATVYKDETNHWRQCANCTERTDEEAHTVPCNASGVCTECGKTGCTNAVEHSNVTVSHNDTEHWVVCGICKETISGPFEHNEDEYANRGNYHVEECLYCGYSWDTQYQHSISCTDSSTCRECGASVTGVSSDLLKTYHTGAEFERDDTYHWISCTDCGNTDIEKSQHLYACVYSGCVGGSYGECGYAMPADADVKHMWYYGRDAEIITHTSETEHWGICEACEEEVEGSRASHTISCDAPGVCTECKATGCTNEASVHAGIENAAWVTDDMQHWLVCSSCGEQVNLDYHYNLAMTFESTDTHCWQICDGCGIEYGKTEHHAICPDEGVCSYCDTAFVGETQHWVDGSFEWDGDSTQHWYHCDGCDTKLGTSDHTVDCTEPGLCTECGATGCTNSLYHVGTAEAAYDAACHWQTCNSCNAEISGTRESHIVSCLTPGKCLTCGVDYVNESYFPHSNVDWNTPGSDAEYHWYFCNDCNAQIDYAQHYNLCTDMTHCHICGAAYSSGYTADECHDTVNIPYSSDATQHWQVCRQCGETIYADHTVTCANPGVCTACGATGCTNAATTHAFDYDHRKYDETTCWIECTGCGAIEDILQHRVDCTKPGVCYYCDIPYDGEPEHFTYGERVYEYDDETHWTFCDGCGIKIAHNSHSARCDNPDVCDECGVTGLVNTIYHPGLAQDFTFYDEEYHFRGCSVCGVEQIIGGKHTFSAYETNEQQHSRSCSVCSYTQTADHNATCVSEGKCAACGVACSDEGEHTAPETIYYSSDSTNHWYYCINGCDTVLFEEEHDVPCADETGTCTVCGRSGLEIVHTVPCENGDGACTECGKTGLEITHTVEEGKFTVEDQYHWQVCIECGAEVNKGEHEPGFSVAIDENYHYTPCYICNETMSTDAHFNFCTDPDHCYECEVEYSGDTLSHWYSGIYEGDETQHWMLCEDCNEIIPDSYYNHSVSCVDPTHCGECGMECGETDEIFHNIDWSIYEHDEEYHWYPCQDCGEPTYKSNHYAACDTSGICFECGVPYDGEDIVHIDTSSIQYDAENHWEHCYGCGQDVLVRTHFTFCDEDPDHCFGCGFALADAVDPQLSHVGPLSDWCIEGDMHWRNCATCSGKAVYKEHIWKESEKTDAAIYYTCICGASKEELLHTEHTWVETSRTEAACGVKGEVVFTCECGESKTEEIPALMHSYTTAETPATCEVDGKKVTTCENCGDETVEVIPAIGHKYATVETPATCEVDGKKVTTCENCGDETVEVLPAIGHKYATVETPTTCEVDGKKVTTCENCGDETAEVIPAIGHKYTTVETPATCLDEGKKMMTCENCGEVVTEVLPIVDHAFEIVSNAAAQCTTDGERVIECIVCGKEVVYVTPATGHDYVLVSDAAPTCEEDGEKLSTCSVCGFELADITPATGHDYDAYAAKGDGTHVSECTVCGHERERACSYQNVTTNGITLTVCTVCGHTRFAHIAIAPVVTPAPAVTESAEATEETASTETTETAEQGEAAQPETAEEAETAVPDTLFIPVKVENVVVKSAKDDAEEVLPAGTQLVVYDQSAMLQEDSPILALYTIGLESDGYARKPEEALRIELPLTEEQTAEDFAEYKLVVIHMDGTMTEIEYEIEDGKIIFETDLVGIFAFLPIEE